MINNYFLKMIKILRHQEEIMLFNNILTIDKLHAEEVVEYLKSEYFKECYEYPYKSPEFNSESALWAATILYVASQLMLYRKNNDADLELLLPDYLGHKSPEAILSADLCLRFLPDIIFHLKQIDSEDILIPILEKKLTDWPYSAINSHIDIANLNLDFVLADASTQQLCINRIIEYQKIELAKHPVLKNIIGANLGIYTNDFWKEFKSIQ